MPLQLILKIHGMDCAEEVAVLKRELSPLIGGEERLAFDILNGRLIVEPGAAEVSAEALIQAVQHTGMRAEVWRDEKQLERLGCPWDGRIDFIGVGQIERGRRRKSAGTHEGMG
jgi:Cd2+/Zn2+-exporting ATPase